MAKKLYFMHPINTYDTDIEQQCLAIMRRVLCEDGGIWDIENPNQQVHDEGYKRYRGLDGKIGMDYFTEEVMPQMQGGVFLPFRDDTVGAGIWKEADWLIARDFPVWEVSLSLGVLHRVFRIPDHRRGVGWSGSGVLNR